MKLTIWEYTVEGDFEEIEKFLVRFPPYPMMKDIHFNKNK